MVYRAHYVKEHLGLRELMQTVAVKTLKGALMIYVCNNYDTCIPAKYLHIDFQDSPSAPPPPSC